jgi:3-isopropylmalate/(R)-2-methylmalate dehydratase large subunit
MKPQTFAEKIFKAPAGAIVFAKPDLILTHDNTSSIFKTFQKMGGQEVAFPDQLLVVLDHNAPPADSKLATQYQDIRDIVNKQGISTGNMPPADGKPCQARNADSWKR